LIIDCGTDQHCKRGVPAYARRAGPAPTTDARRRVAGSGGRTHRDFCHDGTPRRIETTYNALQTLEESSARIAERPAHRSAAPQVERNSHGSLSTLFLAEF